MEAAKRPFRNEMSQFGEHKVHWFCINFSRISCFSSLAELLGCHKRSMSSTRSRWTAGKLRVTISSHVWPPVIILCIGQVIAPSAEEGHEVWLKALETSQKCNWYYALWIIQSDLDTFWKRNVSFFLFLNVMARKMVKYVLDIWWENNPLIKRFYLYLLHTPP